MVSRLSQTRRHSLGHSQITNTGSEYEATAARPSGRDEDHFLASIAGKRQERMGEAREGRATASLVHGQITKLRGSRRAGPARNSSTQQDTVFSSLATTL